MKIYAESYGCTMNRSEAGEFMRAARESGHTVTSNPSKASVALLATCVVIESTERKMLKRLRALHDAGLSVVMMGCMGATRGEKAREVCPGVVIAPPGDIKAALALLENLDRPARPISKKAGTPLKPPRLVAAARQPFCTKGDVIFPVPISSGCRGTCSYCITKLARGDIQSRTVRAIREEVKRALAAGAKEIQLCAQDSAAFGIDRGERLPDLVRSIASSEGNFMVRVGMMNPSMLAPILKETIEAFGHPKVYKFLHLPVQSGADTMLKAMGRRYTEIEWERQIAKFRKKYPDLTLSTDVIVGFPGEADEAHRATIAMLKRVKPDIVNVTRFSPRPGTLAFNMKGDPPGAAVKARSRELTELRFIIALSINKRQIGKHYRVLTTERGKGETTLSRTTTYKQVIIKDRLPLGRFVGVEIVGATRINLVGKTH
jgi:threonylcarbamoyladenosine tRNA methylthiotransferase CDKAL1